MRRCSSRRYAGSPVLSANCAMLSNPLCSDADASSWPSSSDAEASSFTFAEELPDRVHDRVAVADFAGDQAPVGGEVLLQILDELTRAVGTLDLPVAEDVGGRQQGVLEQLHA